MTLVGGSAAVALVGRPFAGAGAAGIILQDGTLQPVALPVTVVCGGRAYRLTTADRSSRRLVFFRLRENLLTRRAHCSDTEADNRA